MTNKTLPLDYQLQHEELAQRQALTQSLMQQALQPNTGRMAGSVYARPGAVSEVGAPIVQALLARRMMDQNSARSKELAEMYKTSPVSDEKFGHTPVKMNGPEGKLIDVLIGDRGTVRPVEGYAPAVKQEATAGGQLYDPYTGKSGEWKGEKFGPTQTVNGEAVQFDSRSGKAHQVATRPSQVRVNSSVTNQGESEFMKTLGKESAQMVTAARQAKQQGQATMVMADRLEQLDKSGIFSGPTANLAVTIGSFAKAAGISVDERKLAASEAYQSQIGEQAARALAGPGGAKMTDKDMELFLSQFPQLIQSPQGRAQIIQRLRTAGQNDIAYADQVQANLKKNFPEAERLFDIAPSTQPYPVSGQPAAPQKGKVIRFEDLP